MYELVPTNIDTDDPAEQGPCPGPVFNASQIPAAAKEELSCVYYNSEGAYWFFTGLACGALPCRHLPTPAALKLVRSAPACCRP